MTRPEIYGCLLFAAGVLIWIYRACQRDRREDDAVIARCVPVVITADDINRLLSRRLPRQMTLVSDGTVRGTRILHPNGFEHGVTTYEYRYAGNTATKLVVEFYVEQKIFDPRSAPEY